MALKFEFNQASRKLSLEEIVSVFVDNDIIDNDQATFILKKKSLSKKHPLISLSECDIADRRMEGKILSLDDLSRLYASFIEVRYFEIDSLKIDIDKVTGVLPKAFVKRLGILPVEVNAEEVTFATSEPFSIEWLMDVERATKKKVVRVFSNPRTIENSIDEFYTVQKAVKHLNKKNLLDRDSGREKDLERMFGEGSALTNAKDENGVSGIVDWLFQFAYEERATDIHLESKMGKGEVRFRVDGTLRVVYRFDPEIMLSVLSRIKILADMKVDEKRRPQDGRIKRVIDEERTIEIRSSTIPTHYGEKMVLRIFDPKMAEKGLKDVGFEKNDFDRFYEIVKGSYGLVLVTGPTGSGKSTTLHSTLKELSSPEVNICTAEDPIEIINESFNQMQINKSIDLTFGNAIRAFLRQDPDIIMVGEIRDTDTSEMAVQASLTGHMVFSTLHTNCALSSITRLVDLGVPPHLLTASLKAIVAQRLVRVLCPHCKKKTTANTHLWNTLCNPYKVKPPESVFEAVGCPECKNTGYKGRVCIYELVVMDDQLRSVIHKDVELSDLQKASNQKFTPMRIHGAKKIAQGITDIEEVLRVVV